LRTKYLVTLKQLSERPNVFVKGSEILRRIGGKVPLKLSSYKSWLDTLWELFGEDRLFLEAIGLTTINSLQSTMSSKLHTTT